jgi:hypothetical protein
MKISEIIKLEKDNTSKCYLTKDGMFWRAYEKSAFLDALPVNNSGIR